MNWVKENIGLDWFDLGVHVTLTGLVIGALSEANAPDVGLILVTTGSVLVLAVRRAWALRRRRSSMTGINSGEMAAMRFEEMEQRLAELEANQVRIAELEERLEFAERLLAEPAQERLLPLDARGKEAH